MIRVLLLVGGLAGCEFEDDRTEMVCEAAGTCPVGQSCVDHFCVLRDATTPDAPPLPPDVSWPDAAMAPPDLGIPGCPPRHRCLTPTKDTYADQARPETAHGEAEQVVVASEPTGERWAYLGFDLATITEAPSRAELTLRLRRADPPASERAARVHLVGVFWDEEAVTWNLRPPIAAESVVRAALSAGVGERQAWNVTRVVREAIADGRSQLAFGLDVEPGDGAVIWSFVSREGGDAPLLVLAE